MVLPSVIARPASVRCIRPASASAAVATADRPAAAPPARADPPDRRARATPGRARRRGSVRDGAAWMACSCHSCAAARACRLARRARASGVPARCQPCDTMRPAHPSQAAITSHIVRPSPASCTASERIGRRASHDPRLPAPRGRHVRFAHRVHAGEQALRGATGRRFALPYIETPAHMTEIVAAHVRVVTYPFPGFIHHDFLSPTPAACGPRVRRRRRLDGGKGRAAADTRHGACARRNP